LATIPDLTSEQWDELAERLTLYASCRVIRLSWRGLRIRKGQSFLGLDAADLAGEAIAAVIDGRRESWNIDAYPDFYRFLQSIVDSKISALVRSAENRRSRTLEPVDKKGSTVADFASIPHSQSPDNLCEAVEWKEKFRVALEKELADDSISKGLFECLDAGMTDRSEIAELFGVSINEIYNAQKRLNPRVLRVMKKLDQGKKP